MREIVPWEIGLPQFQLDVIMTTEVLTYMRA